MPTSFFRSVAAVAAVGAGTLAFLGTPAAAQTCYPPTPGCATTTTGAVLGAEFQLADTSLVGCQTVTPTITGFRPGTTGIITIASVEQQIGSFTVSASGTATPSVALPANVSPGAHTLFARGTLANGQAGSVSRNVTVTGECRNLGGGGGSTSTTGGTGSSLARTGVIWLLPAAVIGGGLVLGGVALKRSSRRGRTSTPA